MAQVAYWRDDDDECDPDFEDGEGIVAGRPNGLNSEGKPA